MLTTQRDQELRKHIQGALKFGEERSWARKLSGENDLFAEMEGK